MTQQTGNLPCAPVASAYRPAQRGSRSLASRGKKATDVVGKVGRVTGTVAPGQVGEVVLTTDRGSDAFHAYASVPDLTIPVGSRVVVLEHYPPRTVVVEPL